MVNGSWNDHKTIKLSSAITSSQQQLPAAANKKSKEKNKMQTLTQAPQSGLSSGQSVLSVLDTFTLWLDASPLTNLCFGHLPCQMDERRSTSSLH